RGGPALPAARRHAAGRPQSAAGRTALPARLWNRDTNSARYLSSQVVRLQPGWGGPEAAGMEVERRQALGEVDMKPLASRRVGVPGSKADKRGCGLLSGRLPD